MIRVNSVPDAETPATEATSTSAEPDPVAPPPAKKFRRLASDSQSQNRARAAANNEAPAVVAGLDNELERYTAEISVSSDVQCGLTFWQDRHRQMSYLKLSPLALDLVAAPASQAYVERVFSVCGDLCARKRNRTSANLEQRTFLRMNKKYLA